MGLPVQKEIMIVIPDTSFDGDTLRAVTALRDRHIGSVDTPDVYAITASELCGLMVVEGWDETTRRLMLENGPPVAPFKIGRKFVKVQI